MIHWVTILACLRMTYRTIITVGFVMECHISQLAIGLHEFFHTIVFDMFNKSLKPSVSKATVTKTTYTLQERTILRLHIDARHNYYVHFMRKSYSRIIHIIVVHIIMHANNVFHTQAYTERVAVCFVF